MQHYSDNDLTPSAIQHTEDSHGSNASDGISIPHESTQSAAADDTNAYDDPNEDFNLQIHPQFVEQNIPITVKRDARQYPLPPTSLESARGVPNVESLQMDQRKRKYFDDSDEEESVQRSLSEPLQ